MKDYKKQNYNLIINEDQFTPAQPNNNSLSLLELVKRQILSSPDNGNVLTMSGDAMSGELFDGTNTYRIHEGCPVLYPTLITDNWSDDHLLPLMAYEDPLLKYMLLSQIKQSGEINAPLDSIPARKHQWRYKDFCSGLSGIVLDVGSDWPSHSMQFLPEDCGYIGLDPYAGTGEFRLIGLGEILPIADQSVDAVTFNTSLDHILDYHTAISEAHRVLKQRGTIIIASYAWTEKATLLTDAVHFHHFREYELLGAMECLFNIESIKRYEDPKHAAHRYGIYISASKI